MAKRINKVLDSIEPLKDVATKESPSKDETGVPAPGSPQWTDYVLSLMEDEEVYVQENSGKVYPKAAGLRRIVYNFFQVISSESSLPVIISNGPNAVPTVGVTHTIRVHPKPWFPEVCSGVAVAHPANLDGFVFSGETADTRARCRAYINLLGLDTCSKEEIVDKVPPLTKSEKIVPAQASAIRALCKKMSIDPIKFANSNKDGITYTDLCDVPAEKYHPMMRTLDTFQKVYINGANDAGGQEIMARINSLKN